VDPLAGSYYIESLTDYIEQEALKYLHQIEDVGGVAAAIESGFMRRELDKMFELQHGKRVSGEIPIVGVNKYVHEGEEEREPELHKPNPEALRIQLERLKEIRSQRDAAEVERLLERTRQAARSQENLIPHFIEAVKAYATLGEITGVLKEEFGEFKEPGFIF
jgi:methylmalonyl-CoA mutase N-terminal domain/subunit